MPQLLECPECNSSLRQVVLETSGDYYRWNEDSGKYEADDAQISIVFKCAECHTGIGGSRSDGEEWGIVPEVE